MRQPVLRPFLAFISGLLLFALPAGAQEAAAPASSPRAVGTVFRILQPTFPSENGTLCSASLVSFKEHGCVLLSNRHCVSNDGRAITIILDKREWDSSKDYVTENFGPAPSRTAFAGTPYIETSILQQTKVIRSADYLDLVQLEIPASLRPTCDHLMQVSSWKLDTDFMRDANTQNRQISFIGFPGDYEVYKDTEWVNRMLLGSASFTHFGPEPRQRYLKVHPANVMPGMSGGLATMEFFPGDKRTPYVLGLIGRYKPYHFTTYLLPLDTIHEFLSLPAAAHERLNRFVVWHKLRDLGFRGYSGPVRPSGDNGQRDGGDNSQRDGGNQWLLAADTDVSVFREDDEGFPLSRETILLGVDGKQIDGWDDYSLRFIHAPLPGKVITRSEEGYPPAEIRRGILERMAGHFERVPLGSAYFFSNLFPSVTLSSYEVNRKPPYRLELKNYHETSLQLAVMLIAPDRAKIVVESGKIEDFTGTFNYLGASAPISPHVLDWTNHRSSRFEFDAWLENEAKTVVLRSGTGQIIRCKNRHYLKLICSAEKIEFSLSRSELASAEIQLRLANQTIDGSRIFFRFGELFRSRNPE